MYDGFNDTGKHSAE
jgi:hypothetical protein